MEIRFQNLGPENWKAQAAVVLCREGENLPGECPELDKACPWLAIAPALRDFKGKKGDLAVLHGHPDLNIPRVVIAGLGKDEEINLRGVREAVASALRKCRALGVESVLLPEPVLARLPGGRDRLIEESVCAALLGLYQFDKFKTGKDGILPDPLWLAVGFNENSNDGAQAAARRGESAAEAVALARDLENMPGNMLYPEAFADRVATLTQKYRVNCEVLSWKSLDEMGAGCILAVGRGSARSPRLVVLDYVPKGCENEKPLVFIGKGITFDSGGLCLKPAANMDQMKCDMSGAAAVFAAVIAAAREGVKRRIVGLLACAENLPDALAYRPGDILTALNGETVEVINTDAEGRLVLCDALVYAQKRWSASAIIDIATLTGACAVALGNGLAGLFCDDDALADRISSLGASVGDNFWRLPLWQPYDKLLKSEIADIKNTGPREGGAINAALFLKHFLKEDTLWAHLDIAGVDWNEKDNPLCPEGATGFGVRALLELARGGIS